MRIKTNKIFTQLNESDKKISVFQGGARSGKTYNILIWLIYKSLSSLTPLTFTICRATRPSLKGTVLRDFVDILESMQLYSEGDYNRTDLIYTLNRCIFEFIGIDQPQKIRGRKRDYLFMNEGNEIDVESKRQLFMRTSEKIIIDYNPSMSDSHWIYTDVVSRDDCDFYISTYKDNPFLDEGIKTEIERLQHEDSTQWQIFGLGQRAEVVGQIYTNWSQVDEIPKESRLLGYGLDFGFTYSPTACVAVYYYDQELYIDEIIYDRGLTNDQIINKLRVSGMNRNSDIVADSAEPKAIYEIRKAGFRCYPIKKTTVNFGIDAVRRHKLNVTKRSVNVIQELKNYKYKYDHMTGKHINEPVKEFDHAMDALRYLVSDKLIEKSKIYKF